MMSGCIEERKRELNGKDDDVDLQSLIEQIGENVNVTESQPDHLSGSSSEDELLVLHGNDRLSIDNNNSHAGSKSNFFDKPFFKSLPVSILAKRKIFGSSSELTGSTPSSPTHSSPGTPRVRRVSGSFPHKKPDRLSGSKSNKNGLKPMVWNVWISDVGIWKEVTLSRSSTCALLLYNLLGQLQRDRDLTQWSIIKQNSEMMIERFVEDFELLSDVASNPDCGGDHVLRLCLNRTPGKYLILEKPEQCLPPGMLHTNRSDPDPLSSDAPTQVKRSAMRDILTKTALELCGWLHVLEPTKKTWKKCYCVLRNSGFYYSTKHSSKDSEHLVCVAEIHSSKVWFPISSKKLPGNPPTSFCFCLKARPSTSIPCTRWFCAESAQLKVAWINGLRLILHGNRFHESYYSSRNFDPTNLTRSSSDRTLNRLNGNLVPMDFSGSRGRVIQDPLEVATVKMERRSSCRRLFGRASNAGLTADRGVFGSSVPTNSSSSFSKAIHVTQPWFYGNITREAAVEEIQRHGNLDGTFLLRESHTIAGSVVITVCHGRKSRHIPITQIARDGRLYYTCDNGDTRFLDLIQLVDFHRLNKGTLPCPLLHECSRTT